MILLHSSCSGILQSTSSSRFACCFRCAQHFVTNCLESSIGDVSWAYKRSEESLQEKSLHSCRGSLQDIREEYLYKTFVKGIFTIPHNLHSLCLQRITLRIILVILLWVLTHPSFFVEYDYDVRKPFSIWNSVHVRIRGNTYLKYSFITPVFVISMIFHSS